MLAASLLSLVLGLAAAAAPVQDPSADFQDRFAQGMSDYLDQRYEDAVDSFEACLELDDTSWLAAYNIACCWAKLGAPESGLDALRGAVRRFLAQQQDQTSLLDLLDEGVGKDADLDPIRSAPATSREFVELLDELQVHHYRQRYLATEPAYALAARRAEQGNDDLALAWLRRALDACWGWDRLIARIQEDERLAPLRRREQEALAGLREFARGRNAELIESGERPSRWIDWVDGHRDALMALDVQPAGTAFVSAGLDRTARIWDLDTMQPLRTLRGHLNTVLSVRYSPDGTRLVTASNDRTARIWDAETGEQLRVLRAGSVLQSAAFSPDSSKVVTAGLEDCSASVWDARSGELQMVLTGAEAGLWTAAFTPDGTRVLTGGWDCKVRVYEASTGRLQWTWEDARATIRSLDFAPDGSTVLITSFDGVVRRYDLSDGARPMEFVQPGCDWLASRCDPSGRRVVSTTDAGACVVWAIETGEVLGRLAAERADWMMQAAFSPDGRRVLAVGWDSGLHVWDAATTAVLDGFECRPTAPVSVAFSPQGDRLVTLGEHGALEWDLERGQVVPARGRVPVVRIPRSETARIAWRDAGAYRWDPPDGERPAALLDIGSRGELCMSPDGELVYVAATGSRSTLWSTSSGKQVAALPAHAAADPNYSWQERIRKASFSPDGRLLVTLFHGDNQALLWDTDSGECRARLQGHTGEVVGASFSADGERLLTASLDGSVRVWDVRTAAALLDLVVSDRGACSGAFSPDGRMIATGDFVAGVCLWDARSGRRLGDVLVGHDRPVTGLAFSPDGKRLASSSLDESTRLWDVQDPERAGPIATLVVYPDESWLAFTPELYYSGSTDAARRASVVLREGTFPLDCFVSDLEVPMRLEQALAGEPLEPPTVSLPPRITVLEPARDARRTSGREVPLVIHVSDPDSSVARLEVQQDGLTWTLERIRAGLDLESVPAVFRDTVTIPPGVDETTLVIRATSRRGTRSPPEILRLRCEP